MTYHEHPSKVVRLDAEGVLVGYAPAQEEDCTVWFAIPDSPGDWEGVLGRRAEADRVEIVGVPIFVYDLSLRDEVQVMKSGEGADVVAGSPARRETSPSVPRSTSLPAPIITGGRLWRICRRRSVGSTHGRKR